VREESPGGAGDGGNRLTIQRRAGQIGFERQGQKKPAERKGRAQARLRSPGNLPADRGAIVFAAEQLSRCWRSSRWVSMVSDDCILCVDLLFRKVTQTKRDEMAKVRGLILARERGFQSKSGVE